MSADEAGLLIFGGCGGVGTAGGLRVGLRDGGYVGTGVEFGVGNFLRLHRGRQQGESGDECNESEVSVKDVLRFHVFLPI